MPYAPPGEDHGHSSYAVEEIENQNEIKVETLELKLSELEKLEAARDESIQELSTKLEEARSQIESNVFR